MILDNSYRWETEVSVKSLSSYKHWWEEIKCKIKSSSGCSTGAQTSKAGPCKMLYARRDVCSLLTTCEGVEFKFFASKASTGLGRSAGHVLAHPDPNLEPCESKGRWFLSTSEHFGSDLLHSTWQEPDITAMIFPAASYNVQINLKTA